MKAALRTRRPWMQGAARVLLGLACAACATFMTDAQAQGTTTPAARPAASAPATAAAPAPASSSAPARSPATAPALATAPAIAPAIAPAAGAPGKVRFLVVASNESSLSSVTPGRIATVPVGLGDTVRAGQVMATLDCGEIQARRDAARAELTSARLQHEAKIKLQGLQSAAEVEVELAAANVDRARSQIRVFEAQSAQCVFVAPFAGSVARVHVKVGQGVSVGSPVVDLVGAGPLKARMNVPSSWLAWLKVGARLDATVTETGAQYPLQVTRISGRADAVSQTVEIEAAFVGATENVLPGMSGQALPAL
ncbi:efflux RND transporter periplasmic adaptor subunit [Variovorax rhizosphaerae]|uniref:Efflux RND transporter periplasmic adaptor subunit n=1 Tax=Variovorax rhizosphaerae TaxID=1836200 RepID=A0ABU8WDV0_9BURK